MLTITITTAAAATATTTLNITVGWFAVKYWLEYIKYNLSDSNGNGYGFGSNKQTKKPESLHLLV